MPILFNLTIGILRIARGCCILGLLVGVQYQSRYIQCAIGLRIDDILVHKFMHLVQQLPVRLIVFGNPRDTDRQLVPISKPMLQMQLAANALHSSVGHDANARRQRIGLFHGVRGQNDRPSFSGVSDDLPNSLPSFGVYMSTHMYMNERFVHVPGTVIL